MLREVCMSHFILYDICYFIIVSSTLLQACCTEALSSYVRYVLPLLQLTDWMSQSHSSQDPLKRAVKQNSYAPHTTD